MNTKELETLLAETTEGPWEADAFNNVWSNAPGRHSKVANLFNRLQAAGYDKIPDSEVAANARLIAMAPALARRVIAAEKLVEALREAQKQLKLVHDNAFTQASGHGIMTADGRDFSCYQLNRCSEVSSASKKAIAEWESKE